MAITRIKSSGIYGSKSDSVLAGIPGVMPAPTATDVTTGGTVNVAFTAVTNSTSYGVISSPENITATGTSSPIAVTGLTDGTAYTFQIRGVNSQGTGAYSAASNSVTPTGTAYWSLASANGTGSSGTVTFSSIPSTYKHLEIRYAYVASVANDIMRMRINGDTSSIYMRSGITTTFQSTSSQGIFSNGDNNILIGPYNGADTTYYNVGIIRLHNYTNTNMFKSVNIIEGMNKNTGFGTMDLGIGVWPSTSAISSITLYASTGNFNNTSTFSLYGIKG